MKPSLWLAIPVIALLLPFRSIAQEIDCDVTMNVQALTTEAKDKLTEFAPAIREYINSYRWTKEEFKGEKIKCSITISFIGMQGENHFVAQAFIGTQRPIYMANRSTALLRIIDGNWEFDYVRGQSMAHDDYRFDPLLSFLDFYVYLALGYDADSWRDSYQSGLGTQYFQKAMEIVNRARGTASGGGKGWDVSAQNTYTRAQLIQELLNPKYQVVREAVYEYNYKGLDLLHKDEARARRNMYDAIEKIARLRQKINQQTLIIRTFFDSKYLEIAETFASDPDPDIFTKLVAIDPDHQKNYEEAAAKRP